MSETKLSERDTHLQDANTRWCYKHGTSQRADVLGGEEGGRGKKKGREGHKIHTHTYIQHTSTQHSTISTNETAGALGFSYMLTILSFKINKPTRQNVTDLPVCGK